MYMIAATIKGSPSRDLLGAEELAEVIWAHCKLTDGVEHIRCMCRPGRIGIFLFVQSSDGDGAVIAARSVCERIVSNVPILNGWRVDSCAEATEPPGN